MLCTYVGCALLVSFVLQLSVKKKPSYDQAYMEVQTCFINILGLLLKSALEPFLNILFGLTGEGGLGCEPLRERDDHPSFFLVYGTI